MDSEHEGMSGSCSVTTTGKRWKGNGVRSSKKPATRPFLRGEDRISDIEWNHISSGMQAILFTQLRL